MMIFYEITSVVFISLIISFVVLRIKNLRDKHISRLTKLSRRISFEPKKLNNSLDIVLKKKSIKYEKYQKTVFYTPKEFEVKYPNGIYPEYSIIEKVYGNRHILIHHYKDLSPKGEYIK